MVSNSDRRFLPVISKSFESNVMIGPVLSHSSKFVPFNPQQYNTLTGLNTPLLRVTDRLLQQHGS
ncbi:hypothetical protein [Gloeocapsopsis dulcis]|uniref:hypothetical protein n=1 Tax=Gloeocapsopsis dulcis TaxID=2859516 RepID=UPI00101AE2C2|nr:hypothetical protein [Gloeocapsopsis dulcis]WNN89176.1 hypothetical protein P0S91_23510 [Gloeocapsopsis dulcis]